MILTRTAFVSLCCFVMALVGYAEEAPEPPDADPDEMSLEEISQKLENPLTTLWSLVFQNNLAIQNGDRIDGDTVSNTLFFQPALPIPLGANDEYVFIARPVFPLVTGPVLDPFASDGVDGHETGLGDIQMLSLFGPNRADGIVWGVGSTFKFPTATDDVLGGDKWQAGPAAMLFRLKKPWSMGVLAQHWWSFAGDDNAKDVSRTDIQYIIRRSLPNAWSVGMGPTVTIDWEADSDNQLTLPVGLGVTKTTRIGGVPTKLRLEAHYSVIQPDDFGTEWNIRLQVTPVIKSPFSKR